LIMLLYLMKNTSCFALYITCTISFLKVELRKNHLKVFDNIYVYLYHIINNGLHIEKKKSCLWVTYLIITVYFLFTFSSKCKWKEREKWQSMCSIPFWQWQVNKLWNSNYDIFPRTVVELSPGYAKLHHP
jgi:hypothetical protein